MKKIIIGIFIFIFNIQLCLAEYNPIPLNKRKEYKIEMEQIINKEIPKLKQDTNNYVKEAKQYRNIIIKNNLTSQTQEYNDLANISEMGESLSLIAVFAELIKATDKYTLIDKSILQTDYWITLSDFIIPILKENNVDISELEKSIKYTKKKWKIIDKYYNEVKITS